MFGFSLLLLSCNGGGTPQDSGPDTPADSAAGSTMDSGSGVDSGQPSGDSGDVVDPVDPATVELHGECDLAQRWGGFEVVIDLNYGYSYVNGSVSNGVIPVTVLEEVESDGECRLMRRNNPFCDPPCAAGETCNFESECIPYPETQDLGTVSVAGLEAEVSMEPIEPGYNYFDTSVPHPAFASGALLTLTSTGGIYDPMTLYGVGVEALEIPPDEVVVVEGQALPLSWTPPSEQGRSTVKMELNIDQHGITPITVWCEFEDDGSAEVSATMIDSLISAGVTGFPSTVLNRHTVDSSVLSEGCVDFEVSVPRYPETSVSGYIPCTGDDECPPGQECNTLIEICE